MPNTGANNITHSIPFTRPGEITIKVYMYRPNIGILCEFIDGNDPTEEVLTSYKYNNFSFDWGTGVVAPSPLSTSDNVKMRAHFGLAIPTTSDYIFYFEVNDKFKFYMNDLLITSADSPGNYSHSIHLEAGAFYY